MKPACPPLPTTNIFPFQLASGNSTLNRTFGQTTPSTTHVLATAAEPLTGAAAVISAGASSVSEKSVDRSFAHCSPAGPDAAILVWSRPWVTALGNRSAAPIIALALMFIARFRSQVCPEDQLFLVRYAPLGPL